MSLIQAKTELEALQVLLSTILNEGAPVDNYYEITNILLQIEHTKKGWNAFRDYKDDFLKISGHLGLAGWERATRVYTQKTDRPTKPSYRQRLIAYPDKPKRMQFLSTVNQLEKISALLALKPGSSNLSFVFLRPADLYDQVRPGYVPCPIAGDLKYRDGKLNLSVMFRSIDVLSVGYADIYYMRMLQYEILERAKKQSKNTFLLAGEVGNLNFYISRCFIEKRKKLKNQSTHNVLDGINLTRDVIDSITTRIKLSV